MKIKEILETRTIKKDEKKLIGNMKGYRMMFYVYGIFLLIMAMAGGYITYTILNGILGLQTETKGVELLLLFGVFNVINFFMIFITWFASESSYYRMMEQFTELWLYLKNEEPVDPVEEAKKRYE